MTKQTASNISVTPITVQTSAEHVSVLLDGEMDRADADEAISALCGNAALRRQWHELHRTGDALRSNEVAACDAGNFCERVAAAIAAEPTVLAPRNARRSSGLRRYWIPGVALAASVAAIGFIAVPLLQAPESMSIAKSTAASPAEVSAADSAGQTALPTIANARRSLSPYLAAHHELTANSVVPRAAVYLRSDEGR